MLHTTTFMMTYRLQVCRVKMICHIYVRTMPTAADAGRQQHACEVCLCTMSVTEVHCTELMPVMYLYNPEVGERNRAGTVNFTVQGDTPRTLGHFESKGCNQSIDQSINPI